MWDRIKSAVQDAVSGLLGDSSAKESVLNASSFRTMVSRTGKISRPALVELVRRHSESSFKEFVGYPFLVGSAVLEGDVAPAERSRQPAKSRRTMLFRPAEIFASLRSTDSIRNVVFPLVGRSDRRSNEYRDHCIGSAADNDIVLPDFAISRRHAVIRYREGIYRLFDLESTNGSGVNGKPVPKSGVELKDKDTLSFSRYQFSFLYPETVHRMLK